jgi:IS30 family transposase
VREDGWSLDVYQGRALQSGEFTREEVTCTKTLYNYVDLGLMETRNHHLPEKLSRRTKHHRDRENKKVLGRSIEEREPAINERAEFGHWECDLVIGQKTGDDEVLLTLAERMSREYWMIPLSSKEAASVMEAFEQIRMEYSEHFSEVFKTITTDRGIQSRISWQLFRKNLLKAVQSSIITYD